MECEDVHTNVIWGIPIQIISILDNSKMNLYRVDVDFYFGYDKQQVLNLAKKRDYCPNLTEIDIEELDPNSEFAMTFETSRGIRIYNRTVKYWCDRKCTKLGYWCSEYEG